MVIASTLELLSCNVNFLKCVHILEEKNKSAFCPQELKLSTEYRMIASRITGTKASWYPFVLFILHWKF